MGLIQSIIEFFKKTGMLKADVETGTYKSSKDAGYKAPDPIDTND